MNRETENKRIETLIEYLCIAYQTDYNGLADLIGCNRGWFTRYRNASFGDKGVNTTMELVKLAANVSGKRLFGAVFDE